MLPNFSKLRHSEVAIDAPQGPTVWFMAKTPFVRLLYHSIMAEAIDKVASQTTNVDSKRKCCDAEATTAQDKMSPNVDTSSMTPQAKDELKSMHNSCLWNLVPRIESSKKTKLTEWAQIHNLFDADSFVVLNNGVFNGRFTRGAGNTLFWIKNGGELSQASFLYPGYAVDTPNTSVVYVVAVYVKKTSDVDDIVNTERGRSGRRSKSALNPKVPNRTADSLLPSECGRDLYAEYNAHVLWLRMIKVPCQLNINTTFGSIPEQVTFIEPLTGNELTRLGDRLKRAKEVLLAAQPYVENAVDDDDDSTSTAPTETYSEEVLAYQPYDLEEHSNPNNQAFSKLIKEINDLPNEDVAPRSFQPFKSSGAQAVRVYVAWLKMHLIENIGSIYSGSAAKQLPTNEFKQRMRELHVEHVTPQSWTQTCSMLMEFHTAPHDPISCFACKGKDNQSRGKKPLRFALTAPDDCWPVQGISLSKRACIARAIVYTALTYPLVSDLQGTPLKRLNVDTIAEDTGGPLGVLAYYMQYKELMRLIKLEPEDWEIDITCQCFLRFQVVNPLVVSKRVRDTVSDSKTALGKLVALRWSGKDRTSAELLDFLKSLGR